MITKSSWFVKNNQKDFRERMINEYGLKLINHYDEARVFFPDTQIKTGVSYFLLEKG